MPLELEINGKNIALTNLQKELWPGEGITKYHLLKYFLEISPFLLPHLKDRFLVFQRFPEGIHREGFFQKNVPSGAPHWIKTIPFKHGGTEEKITNYIIVTGPETLVWLGNQACVEIHPWLSSLNTPDVPDYAVFDFDPVEGISLKQLCQAVLVLREVLQSLNLRGYPKTSGSRGIQVFVPLVPLYSYETARLFVEKIFQSVREKLPSFTTMERKKKGRGQKIYLDYLQNARGKTIIAPYSPRPLPGAHVSTPLQWEEIENPSAPLSYNINTVLARLYSRGDLFDAVLSDRQQLPGYFLKS